ncbi:hypothetical protein [Caballeronia sp. dw_19]|nr:hypothetical protein [Caballeronia sp. dw_19]
MNHQARASTDLLNSTFAALADPTQGQSLRGAPEERHRYRYRNLQSRST